MQEYLNMKKIRIQFTWLTAFYAPLVVTLTRSFGSFFWRERREKDLWYCLRQFRRL